MFRKSIKSFILLLVITLLVGCNNSNSIIGTWVYVQNDTTNENIYYLFNKNNTGEYNYSGEIKKFEYEDRGTKIIINYENSSTSNEFDYSIENNILNINDSFGKSVTYKRK